MRWVDRGPEPAQIARYADQFTQGWVAYYTNRDPDGNPVLPEPEDHEWSYFSETLGNQSNGNCWYCERRCQAVGGWAPSVDHFRPRSLFPELTYRWSNWIFSCRRCNADNKKDKWPESGYVDPGANDILERPERYFDYEEDTGEIVAKSGLSEVALSRAWATIDDLDLSGRDLRNPRFTSVRQFREELREEMTELPDDEREAFISGFLALAPDSRIAFLLFSASSNGQTLEYVGLKAMVAEKLLREGGL